MGLKLLMMKMIRSEEKKKNGSFGLYHGGRSGSMFCGSLTNFRGCKFWMLNGKKGMCFGVIDFLGAVDVVASMGKRVFFKWTTSISESKIDRRIIGGDRWLLFFRAGE